MASRDEFTAFIQSDHQQQVNGGNGNTWGGQSPASKTRPPQPPKTGEQAPLLTQQQPMPQSVLPPQFQLSLSQQLMMSHDNPKRGHARSRSDCVLGPPDSPSYPLKKGGSPVVPPPAGAPGPNRSNRPPRAGVSGAGIPLPSSIIGGPSQSSIISPLGSGSPKPNRKNNAHRRAKSDIPLALFGGSGASVSGGGRTITKEDLLKSLPNPRWGGAPPKPLHTRNRSRAGSDGPLLDGGASPRSSFSGYGATSIISGATSGLSMQSIGSIDLHPDAKRSTRHIRAMSDASVKSVTTDMAKSALFKAVTDTGRIQMQLPKDSFRILMDCQLEAGMVYKRKLVDEEDQFFVEFHSVEDDPAALDGPTCLTCQEKQKRLPPDLYVMAVDSSIYRRMLDEVIASKTMPCGTFFCGHHDDVRHPDITIAALVVGVVFFLFLAGAIIIWD